MTKLKTTIALDDTCSLTVTDTSGFYNSQTFPNGFLPQDDSSELSLNNYKINQGYFLNVLLYNKYAVTPVISNKSDTMYLVQGEVSNTYADNFTPSTYVLKQDGSYTLKRFFIPTQEFYDVNKENEIYAGITMYYADESTIYKVIDGEPAAITRTELVAEDLLSSNALLISTAFISTCYTNTCYYKILSSILDGNLAICETDPKINELKTNRDILYMTLETIKYLKQQNNISQVQKLIEALNLCGGICAKTLNASSSTNCGCNG